MYFDPIQKAYIDTESGQVVYREENGVELTDVYVDAAPRNDVQPSSFAATIARPQSYTPLSKQRSPTVAPTPDNEALTTLEQELYDMHVTGADIVEPTVTGSTDRGLWDDWTMARTLQAMEFEIPNEMIEEEGDFNRKEYHASRSCRRQLATLSCFIVVVQIALLIAMIQVDGYDSNNPVIGPPVYTMVRFGAKEAGMIVYKNQWWRLLSSIMLHGGIFHMIPNGAIQLRVGGYLNLVYGTPKWFFIYFISGIFGSMMSCCFLPESVGVGASGALMGMLSSWVVWIIFRWKKIPHQCKSQRNCQLFIVVAAIVVTLATSFTPNVDWAAHAGGALQGILWGIVLLSSELDHERNQMWLRIGAGTIACTLFGYTLYFMAEKLHPSKENFSYWDQHDDWN